MTKSGYTLVVAASAAIGFTGAVAAAQTLSAAPLRDQAVASSASAVTAAAVRDRTQGPPPAAEPSMQSVTDGAVGTPPEAAATSATTVNASGVSVVSSPTVPDTPANRSRYGGPMSHGGERTPAIGD